MPRYVNMAKSGRMAAHRRPAPARSGVRPVGAPVARRRAGAARRTRRPRHARR